MIKATLDSFLTYPEKEQLQGWDRTRRSLSRFGTSAIEHPFISAFASAAIGLAAYTAFSGVKAGIDTLHATHEEAVNLLAGDIHRPATQPLKIRHWGVERTGTVIPGHIQYANASPAQAIFNQAMQASSAPGTGAGGCFSVQLRRNPANSNPVMGFLLPDTITLTSSLTSVFNDKNSGKTSPSYTCSRDSVPTPAAPANT